jgi:hypothetical protein
MNASVKRIEVSRDGQVWVPLYTREVDNRPPQPTSFVEGCRWEWVGGKWVPVDVRDLGVS